MDEMIEQVNPTHVTLDDLEELICALSPEEIEELAECDPDDSSMPPSMRCAYKCNKEATGEVNREMLLEGLKDQALAIPDKEDKVKWEQGVKRGKIYVPKVEEVKVETESEDEDEERMRYSAEDDERAKQAKEFVEALDMATPNDLIDIADILGVTFQDDCVATPLKFFEPEKPNDTNIDEVIKQATSNDGELMDINLNNIKNISKAKWEALFGALKDNSTVESFSAANCDITDSIVKLLCDTLETNTSIRQLNLESNSVTGDMVLNIIKSTGNTKCLEELKISNQFNNLHLGSSIEYALAEIIPKYPHLVKLGVRMEFRDTLNKCAMALCKNLDKRRQTEDRTFTLKMDKTGKTGPKIVQEKR